MSKGHAALSYYLVLMKLKFFSEKFIIKEYLTDNGKLGGHPDMNKKLGIDFSSGSLGNGISVATGMAYAYKADRQKNKVFTLIGDGECNEGIVWETALFAGHHKLDNLFVIMSPFNFAVDFKDKRCVTVILAFIDPEMSASLHETSPSITPSLPRTTLPSVVTDPLSLPSILKSPLDFISPLIVVPNPIMFTAELVSLLFIA